MTHDEIVRDVILPSLDELRDSVDGLKNVDVGGETALFGQNGLLDSINLVSLIVILEEKIEGRSGQALRLVTDRAFSQKSSPFRTVSTLATYIEGLAATTAGPAT